MKRLLAVLLLSGTAFAGTSAVTATITDSDSQTWNNGKYTATLNSPNGPPTISGVKVTATFFSGSLSSSGVLTQTMTDTSTLDQTGATWCFVITPNASAPAGGTCLAVTGATPNLSTALSASVKAPRFAPGVSSYGYLDAEVLNPILGSSYYNVTTPCYRQFSQTGWGCGPTGGVQTINGTAPIVASTTGSTTTVSYAPPSGTGTPQGNTCIVGQTYTQNVGGVSQIWIPSPNCLVYVNQTTGAVVYAGSGTHLTGNQVACFPLTATSGTTVTNTCGSVTGTWGGSGLSWNSGNGLNFTGSGYVQMSDNSVLAVGYTYQFCISANGTNSNSTAIMGNTNFANLGFDSNGRPKIQNTLSMAPQTVGTSVTFLSPAPTCYTFVTDAATNQIWSGTAKVPALTSNNGSNNFPGNLAVGIGGFTSNGSFNYTGTIYSVRIWNAELSYEQIQYEAAIANAEMSSRSVTTNNTWTGYGSSRSLLYSALGDSLTLGIDSSNTWAGFPGYVASSLNANVNMMNFGIGAQSCAGVSTYEVPAAAAASTMFPSTVKIATSLCGTNDLPFGSISTEYGFNTTIWTGLHAAGYKVIALTVPPLASCSGTCESGTNGREQYNTYLIAQQQYDGLVDIGSDPRFNGFPFNYNFNGGDGIHFNDAGYQIVAGRTLTEMNRLKVTGRGDIAPQVAYSATPNFDLSQGLHQSILLTGNVTYFTVSNYNQGTEFTIDFIQDGSGGHTVGMGVLGSGATATAPLTGSLPVFVLVTGGSNYKTGWPPYITATGGTCTTEPVFIPVLTAGAVSSVTTETAGNCSVAPTLTFVSTEPVWHGTMTVDTTANKVSTQKFHYDSTTANVYAEAAGVTGQ